jgi:dipeptidyl aminopeptidase/acylaminoacyl peptidase
VDVMSLETGERRTLVDGFNGAYVSTGHIVFGRENGLWAAPFSLDGLDVSGPPFPVEEGVAVRENGETLFAVSASGSLAYVPTGTGLALRRPVLVDRQGNETATPFEASPYESVRFAPEGRRVAVEVAGSSSSDIWILDLERGSRTKLTLSDAHDGNPLWSPDGAFVVFGSDRAGSPSLFRKPADGTGVPEQLTTGTNFQAPVSFTRDGGRLFFTENRVPAIGFNFDIGLLAWEPGGAVEWLVEDERSQTYAELSPDGRWLAYTSVGEVFVRPFPDLEGGRWQVSPGLGAAPKWGPGGDEIFYLETRGSTVSVMRVEVETARSFAASAPAKLFEGPYLEPGFRFRGGIGFRAGPYDLSPDGQHFLMLRRASSTDAATETQDIVVVRHWNLELMGLAAARPPPF